MTPDESSSTGLASGMWWFPHRAVVAPCSFQGMATKTMPGTPKARSVARPAQGAGVSPRDPGRPKGLRPVKATPRYVKATRRTGMVTN